MWNKETKLPFPLKMLVNQKTIKIDTAFKVNRIVSTPVSWPC